MDDLANARAILEKLLTSDVDGAYRRQLAVAELRRHATGCSIHVDRDRADAAPYDPQRPSAMLIDGFGHGKLWVMLHVHEGYLDDLELLDAARFPDPATVRPR